MDRVKKGLTTPLGASVQLIDGQKGLNFALFSQNATEVELCLFSSQGKEFRFKMNPSPKHIWTIWLAGFDVGIKYGFRIYGENNFAQGHHFNPNKLMLDPYAKAVANKPCYNTTEDLALFDFTNQLDNSHIAPKAIVVDETFDWQNVTSPNYSWAETIIYELHIKGFSQLNHRIPENLRGTYAGLAHPESINYLKSLGVTTLELMPVALHADELHLQQKELSNYWGYNTLAPFAVETKYWSGRAGTTPISEFKEMVKTLHQAGFEIILDVVFNHTADSEYTQPTLSQRGIDNASYYWLNEDGYCHNWSGCGNVLNLSHPNVRQWVLDCLRYWAAEFHIDGFRFDLATIVGREPHFNKNGEFFAHLEQDPILKGKKYIAEPWDIGPDGYQLGNFPNYFAEWNDRFRDQMRQFWLHYYGNMGTFAQRFSASADLFKQETRKPNSTINYICSHDGFTLDDLVSYREKQNWANGEENRDGHNDNHNTNFGTDGITDDEAILHKRFLAKKALLATLLLAKGTPMLFAGDEFGNSQQGNNNAYCQDNELTWLDWQKGDQTLLNYTCKLIELRKKITALSRHNEWWTEQQVHWWNRYGQEMDLFDWEESNSTGFQIEIDNQWLIVINRAMCEQHYTLPSGEWKCIDGQALEMEGNAIRLREFGVYILSR